MRSEIWNDLARIGRELTLVLDEVGIIGRGKWVDGRELVRAEHGWSLFDCVFCNSLGLVRGSAWDAVAFE